MSLSLYNYGDMNEAQAVAAAADLLGVLSSSLRLRLLLLLEQEPHRVTDLVDALGVSQPLVSRHLRVLREAALVTGERHGREVVYSVADEHVAHIVRDAVAHAAEQGAEQGEVSVV